MENEKEELKPQEEGQKEPFSFLQETIKDEADTKEKVRNLILKYIGLGLVFGLAASLSFYALKPWVENKFQSNPKKVTIPVEKEDKEQEDTEEKEASMPVMTVDSYREMNQALYGVANEANKSMVEITAAGDDKNWQDAAYDKEESVAGIIVADNGPEFLILAKSTIVKNTEKLTATFADGRTYPTTLKRRDETTGMAVFSVARSGMQESTFGQIKVATLGSSNAVGKGDVMIALGKPFGYSGGMGFGIVSSVKNVVNQVDGDYGLICTDIAGTAKGTGVLVNMSGEVIGMVDQSISSGDSMNLVTAYGISDLKRAIEFLSNGEAVPYVGMKGVTVTEEIASTQGIPRGLFVQEVSADSPAMAAGIQSGDIITNFDGTAITTVSVYQNELMTQSAERKVKIKAQRQGVGGYVDIEFNVTIGSKE